MKTSPWLVFGLPITVLAIVSTFMCLRAIKNTYSVRLYEQGKSLLDRGEYKGAIRKFRKSISLNPTLPFTHNYLGVALTEQGQLDDAIAEFRKALDLASPGYPSTHYFLGNALRDRGDRAEAQHEWELTMQGEEPFWATRAKEQASKFR